MLENEIKINTKFDGAQPLPMTKSKKVLQFVNSFMLVPIMSANISLGSFMTLPQGVLDSSFAVVTTESAPIIESEKTLEQDRLEKAAQIDAYYTSHNLPLAGYGMKMVIEAEKNNIDWRLIPALGMRESTGGKFACKNATFSPFGYGSCKLNFDSYDHAIEVVARSLGGNNPKTASHYKNKTTEEKLKSYNPPSIVARYADQVMAIMSEISPNA
jgi:hypothetical protein